MRTKEELKSIFEKTDEFREKDTKIYNEMSGLLEKYSKYILIALTTDQENTKYAYTFNKNRFMAQYNVQEGKNVVHLVLFDIDSNTTDIKGILGIFEVGTDGVFVKQGSLLPKAVIGYKEHIENHLAGILEKYINR